MQSGRLRRRLIIQRRVPGLDADGEPLDHWTTEAVVWGEVSDASATETVRDGATIATTVATVTIRHRGGITPAMRIKDRDRVLEIVSPPIDSTGLGRELTMTCREITVPKE